MNSSTTLLISIALTFTIVTGCASSALKDGAKDVVLTFKTEPNCTKIENKKYTSPIVLFEPEKYKENLYVDIKNDAFEIGADEAFIKNEPSAERGVSSTEVTFYSCKSISSLNDKALEKVCSLGNGAGCSEIAVRSQMNKNFPKMFDFFKKACALNDKRGCDWLINYDNQKAQFKKSCIKKDGESCFAAAKLADVEQDISLLMTFLKQGCSYGHAESCFYSTYVQEEKERIKEIQQNNYQQYMANLQKESLRQQQISAAMAVLNQMPKTCTSYKNFDGSVSTRCN